MAQMFSLLSSRRIPLAVVHGPPHSNYHRHAVALRSDNSNGHRVHPYTRHAQLLGAKLDAVASAQPTTESAAKPPAFSPVRKSALTNYSFILPLRVGHYELQRPWSDEMDWFEALDLDSRNVVLCKVCAAVLVRLIA